MPETQSKVAVTNVPGRAVAEACQARGERIVEAVAAAGMRSSSLAVWSPAGVKRDAVRHSPGLRPAPGMITASGYTSVMRGERVRLVEQRHHGHLVA